MLFNYRAKSLYESVCHKSIFAPSPPPTPAIIPPAPLPQKNDPAIAAAKTKQVQTAMQQSGRQSTILTGNDSGSNDKFGA